MIIQCRKCGTKYRFDETLIAGVGVWVRCTRCREVFYQDAPAIKSREGAEADPAAVLLKDKAAQDLIPQENSQAGLPSPEAPPEPGVKAPPAREISFLSEMRELMNDEAGDRNGGPGKMMLEGLGEKTEEIPESVPEEIEISETGEKRKGRLGGFVLYLFIFLAVIAGMGVAYFRYYPGADRELLRPLASGWPFIGGLVGLEEKKDPESHRVRLVDIKQRFLANSQLGSLLVVEGRLVNTGTYPLARIQVKGEFFDHKGQLLSSRTVYLGNLLTEAELLTFSEEEIQARLSNPEGSSHPVRSLAPGEGQPFMVFFIGPGDKVAKTVVSLVSAQRPAE